VGVGHVRALEGAARACCIAGGLAGTPIREQEGHVEPGTDGPEADEGTYAGVRQQVGERQREQSMKAGATLARGRHSMFRRTAVHIMVATALATAVVGVVSVQLLTAPGRTAHASPATPITINTVDDFSTPHPTGTFVASAPLCASGTFIDLIVNHEDIANKFLVDRTLTCDDGSGTFTIHLHVQFPRQATDSAPWSINGGTGAYTTLHGTGTWTTVSTGPTSGADTLTGEVHFD
jgi:hypothetical protein